MFSTLHYTQCLERQNLISDIFIQEYFVLMYIKYARKKEKHRRGVKCEATKQTSTLIQRVVPVAQTILAPSFERMKHKKIAEVI